MAYFDYHSHIKKLIANGKLKSYHFEKSYGSIGFALVLCFENKKYPIREEHFAEYFDLIGKSYLTKKVGNIFETTFLF